MITQLWVQPAGSNAASHEVGVTCQMRCMPAMRTSLKCLATAPQGCASVPLPEMHIVQCQRLIQLCLCAIQFLNEPTAESQTCHWCQCKKAGDVQAVVCTSICTQPTCTVVLTTIGTPHADVLRVPHHMPQQQDERGLASVLAASSSMTKPQSGRRSRRSRAA